MKTGGQFGYAGGCKQAQLGGRVAQQRTQGLDTEDPWLALLNDLTHGRIHVSKTVELEKGDTDQEEKNRSETEQDSFFDTKLPQDIHITNLSE
jgi:hypothetical protein